MYSQQDEARRYPVTLCYRCLYKLDTHVPARPWEQRTANLVDYQHDTASNAFRTIRADWMWPVSQVVRRIYKADGVKLPRELKRAKVYSRRPAEPVAAPVAPVAQVSNPDPREEMLLKVIKRQQNESPSPRHGTSPSVDTVAPSVSPRPAASPSSVKSLKSPKSQKTLKHTKHTNKPVIEAKTSDDVKPIKVKKSKKAKSDNATQKLPKDADQKRDKENEKKKKKKSKKDDGDSGNEVVALKPKKKTRPLPPPPGPPAPDFPLPAELTELATDTVRPPSLVLPRSSIVEVGNVDQPALAPTARFVQRSDEEMEAKYNDEMLSPRGTYDTVKISIDDGDDDHGLGHDDEQHEQAQDEVCDEPTLPVPVSEPTSPTDAMSGDEDEPVDAEADVDDSTDADVLASSWTLPPHFAPALSITRVGHTRLLRLDGHNKTSDPSLLELRHRHQFGVEPCASLIVLHALGYAVWVQHERPNLTQWATYLPKQ